MKALAFNKRIGALAIVMLLQSTAWAGGHASGPMLGYGSPDNAFKCETPGQCGGAIQIGFSKPALDLQLWDEPLNYVPEAGPWLQFRVQYDESDMRHAVDHEGVMINPQYRDQMSSGPYWSINWLSYFEVPDGAGSANGLLYYPPGGGYTVLQQYLSGSSCNGSETGVCAFNPLIHEGRRITKISSAVMSSSAAICGATGIATSPLPVGSFVVCHDDGTIDEYAALRDYRQNYQAGAPRIGYRAYWTRRVDRLGLAMQLEWGNSATAVGVGERLTKVTDALGRQTRLEYGDSSNGAPGIGRLNPFLRTVTDPYNHVADLTYIDARTGFDLFHSARGPQPYETTTLTPGSTTTLIDSLWRTNVLRGPTLANNDYRGTFRLTSIVDGLAFRSEIRYGHGYNRSREGRFRDTDSFNEWCGTPPAPPPPTVPEEYDELIGFGYGRTERPITSPPVGGTCNVRSNYMATDADTRDRPEAIVSAYGRWQILRGDLRLDSFNKKRWVIIDPAQKVERYEAWYVSESEYFAPRICAPGVSACGSMSSAIVPGHWKTWAQVLELDAAFASVRSCRDPGAPGTQIEVAGCSKTEVSNSTHPYQLYLRNVLYWSKKAIELEVEEARRHGIELDPLSMGTGTDTVLSLNRAEIYHFLGNGGGPIQASPIISAVKKPQLSWQFYAYPNQAQMGIWNDRPIPFTSTPIMLTKPSLIMQLADRGELATTQMTYNAMRQLQSITEPGGTGYRVDYAANGIDPRTIWRTGQSAAQTRLKAFDYYYDATAPAGRPMSGKAAVWRERDDAGAETEYDYESYGRVARSQKNNFLVRERGRPDRTQNLAVTYSYTYRMGALDRIAGNWHETVTQPDGSAMVYKYERGLLQEERVGSENGPLFKSYSYFNDSMMEDAFGRPWTIMDAAGNVTRYAYRNLHLESTTNGAASTTAFVVDHLMRPTQITLPANAGRPRIVRLTYDASGAVATLTDPQGVVSTWTYDILGRELSQAVNGLAVKSTNYQSPVGLVTQMMVDGHHYLYEYDVARRLKGKWASADLSSWTPIANLNYGDFGRIEQMTDERGTTTYGYDSRFPLRLAIKTVPVMTTGGNKVVVQTQYLRNERGQELGLRRVGVINGVVQRSEANSLDIYTDAQGRISGVDTDIAQVAYEYAAWNPEPPMGVMATFGKLSRRVMSLSAVPNPAAVTGQVIQEYGYHGPSENFKLSRIAYHVNDGGRRVGRWYDEYDEMNRLQEERLVEAPMGARNIYNYSEEGWLRQADKWLGPVEPDGRNREFTSTYSYDANGNRTALSKTFSGLPGSPLQSFSYNYSGASPRLHSITENGAERSIATDPFGFTRRMDGFGLFDEKNLLLDDEGKIKEIQYSGGAERSTFAYDSSGDIYRVREYGFYAATPSIDRIYLWEGGRLIQERDAVTGQLLESYDEFGMKYVDSFGNVSKYAILKDRQGSKIGVADQTGQLFEEHSYDAFGNTIDATGQDIAHSSFVQVGYAGMLRHSRSGLHFTANRALDTRLGRWLSPDPIGFADGLNRMIYTHNDPVNHIDPSGLAALKVDAGVPFSIKCKGLDRKSVPGFDPDGIGEPQALPRKILDELTERLMREKNLLIELRQQQQNELPPPSPPRDPWSVENILEMLPIIFGPRI